MRKTRISIAVLAALVMGSAAPLLAQTANDDPAKDPPAGGRIPASADTPQASGDTASDEPSQTDAASTQSSTTSPQSGATPPPSQAGASTSSGQSGMSGAAGQSSDTAAGTSSAEGRAQGQQQRSGPDGMQGPPQGIPDQRSMQGRWHTESAGGMPHEYRDQYRRGESVQRWNDAQMGWGDEGRSSRYPEFQSGGPDQYYYEGDRYGEGERYRRADEAYWRDRYGPRGRYYDRGMVRDDRRYYGDRDWDAFGEFDAPRWNERDYRARGRWNDLEEGSGYTYRDDYYAGRDDYPYRGRYRSRPYWGPDMGERAGAHMGRGQSYYEDAFGDYRDPYRYPDGNQWRGSRYSGRWQGNQWRDPQDAAGRWDDRQRDWPGAGTGDMGRPDYRQGPGAEQWQRGQYQDGQPSQQSGQTVTGNNVTGATAAGTQPSAQPQTQSGSSVSGSTGTSSTQSGSAVR